MQEDAQEEPAVFKKTEPVTSNGSRKKISFKEKKEYEELQKQINILEAEKKAISEKMQQGDLDNFKLIEASKRISSIDYELDQRTLRWLELEEIISQ